MRLIRVQAEVARWGVHVIRLENLRIGHPHEHGSAVGLESTHSGDGIQKVAYSVTQSAGFVWTRGRSDNISFRIHAIQVPGGRALRLILHTDPCVAQ